MDSNPSRDPRKRELSITTEAIFEDDTLAQVITPQEAMVIWSLSRNQVMLQIYRGTVPGRRSFTGGTWLISYDAALRWWGDPVYDVMSIVHDDD